MDSRALPIPGILLGAYPERRRSAEDAFTRAVARVNAVAADICGFHSRRYARFLAQVAKEHAALDAMTADAMREHRAQVRATLARDGFVDSIVAQAFALVSHACVSALGVRPFDSQLMAARIMLDNRLAEMATGEGKTLAAAVCAATAALAGIPVHVLTANDYLVARDAQSLRPLYAALGLSVGFVTQAVAAAGRSAAYACDITYCTGKELVFDYLRDGMSRSRARTALNLRAEMIAGRSAGQRRTLLRGLCMAIVDEADSILIDEARIPLILSEPSSDAARIEYGRHALSLAKQCLEGQHFVLDQTNMSAQLTAEGDKLIELRSAGLGAEWRNRKHRAEAVCTALAALNLYRRDRHYVVRDGAVTIIDETTGRLAEGRVWSRGLHQAIEAKEGCKPSAELATAAQITYQRFFQRYLRLGGMSGTLREARAELHSVYGLQTVRVPLRLPCKRRVLPTWLFPDDDALWRAVVERVANVSSARRPVLIGTDSVAASETLSHRLAEAGLRHAVLNARQDMNEAQIIARAGDAGAITVATNMAGRGTDIALGAGVAERGGLHILCCQHNASRRIDRQFVGRSARQGDPGSAESFISVDQRLISRFVRRMSRFLPRSGMLRPAWAVMIVVRLPQILEEGLQRAQRRALLEQDAQADRGLMTGLRAE